MKIKKYSGFSYGENLRGKFMGKISGENLQGKISGENFQEKFMRKIYGKTKVKSTSLLIPLKSTIFVLSNIDGTGGGNSCFNRAIEYTTSAIYITLFLFYFTHPGPD